MIIPFVISGQGSWEKLDVPTDHFLRTVYFTDSTSGWAAGDSGTIIHTFNGGNSWELQESNTTNPIVHIFFLDENLGWASSLNYGTFPYGTIILKTSDGGNTWIPEPYPEENIFINCILYLDSLNGWMGGSPHALVKTTDGGTTWHQADIDTNNLAFFPVLSVHFYDENYGYASGGMFDIAGVTWQTSNGGEKWFPINPSDAPADEVHDLYLHDSITVTGAGGDPDFGFGAAVIRTENGGVDWNYEELGIQGNGFDIDFRNGIEGWIPLGPQLKFLYSLDGGDSWTVTETPESTEIYDITFPDSLHGYAVGRDGAFLKYIPPLGVSVQEHYIGDRFIELGQNYPNPFSLRTFIEYRIPNDEYRTTNKGAHELWVWDAEGIMVQKIRLDIPNAGKNRVEVVSTHLSPGIYYYQICTRELKSEIKKMINIR